MSNWRYSRMYNNLANTPVVKVEDPTIPARIDTLLAKPDINDWEKNFLTSIKTGFEKYKSLTEGQNRTFVNIEKRYDADAIAARNAWIAAYDSVKANNFKTMMEYYIGTVYYKGIVEKYRANKDYIPSENEYRAVCENKYSARMLKNIDTPPKFSIGHMIVYKEYTQYHLATVIEVGTVDSWTKGSRVYKINILGDSQIREVFEKDLRYYRESMDKKITMNNSDTPF